MYVPCRLKGKSGRDCHSAHITLLRNKCSHRDWNWQSNIAKNQFKRTPAQQPDKLLIQHLGSQTAPLEILRTPFPQEEVGFFMPTLTRMESLDEHVKGSKGLYAVTFSGVFAYLKTLATDRYWQTSEKVQDRKTAQAT